MWWRPYVPVAERRARALREMNKLRRKGKDIQPVEIEGRTIARSVWGKRWCTHLESWSDYANRLPRGRAYVRNGSVCHLEVHPGRIDAIVSGSELYTVSVRIGKLKAAVWKSIKARCSGQIGSMLELLQGKLSRQVMSVVSDREQGLFPKPREIDFTCTCPDWAAMCKHVAAVLYGVGGRLDRHPEALFLLRGVDAEELIAAELALPASAAGDDTLADDALAGIFGIDIDMEAAPDTETTPPPAKAGRRRTRRKGGTPACLLRHRRARRCHHRAAGTTDQEGQGHGCIPLPGPPRGGAPARPARVPPAAERPLAKRKDASGTPPSATRGGKSSPAAAPRKRGAAKERCDFDDQTSPHRQVGGPAAPALRPLRRRVREPARRVSGHGVPLGSHARSTQPASAHIGRPHPPAPADREAEEALIRQGRGGHPLRLERANSAWAGRSAPCQGSGVQLHRRLWSSLSSGS